MTYAGHKNPDVTLKIYAQAKSKEKRTESASRSMRFSRPILPHSYPPQAPYTYLKRQNRRQISFVKPASHCKYKVSRHIASRSTV